MNKSKRNLAKIISFSIVGASVWKKPIVNAVILPAHAQTSIFTLPAISTTDQLANPDCDPGGDDIAIIFDCNTLSFETGCFVSSNPESGANGGESLLPDDAIIVIDIDRGEGGWDFVGSANWTIDDAGGIVDEDNPNGTYTMRASRPECTVELSFTVTVEVTDNNNDTPRDLSVSNISLVQIS